jgi:hypothetical protein
MEGGKKTYRKFQVVELYSQMQFEKPKNMPKGSKPKE